MIVVKLYGGLGNQMFQYALGRHLAYKHNTELKFDICGYEKDNLRKYSLDCFNIIGDLATFSDLFPLSLYSDGNTIKVLKFVINKISLKKPLRYIKEENFDFQHKILNLPDNVYIEGYWQSELYFLDIGGIIKKEFSLKGALTQTSQKIANQIKDCESVSIHVRRGDYVSNPQVNSVHGICGIEYYHRAIDIIIEKIDNPHFFVFSDDPEWTYCNIKPSAPTFYVRHNDYQKDFEDIYLMSICKHNIIANSSFSWWGAWLNRNPEKIVIAPQKWFNSKDLNTKNLLPEKWYKL